MPYFYILNPEVSIIIPVKNAAPWLHECLQSIAEQDFSAWECILINDHSDDSTQHIISTFAFYDHRFRQIPNHGSGLIDAYKTSLANARGTWIARMDADDIMPAYRIGKMVEALQVSAPKTVVTGKIHFFPEEEIGVGTKFYQSWLNKRMEKQDHWNWIWRECVIPSPCWMARKTELLHIGNFDELEYPEDYNLAFRFFEHGFTVLGLPEILHYWRQHENRYSRTSNNYSAEKFMNMKWHFFEKLEAPKFKNIYLLGTGDKSKYLIEKLDLRFPQWQWISHKISHSGNTINGRKIQHVSEIDWKPESAIISVLSSIDNHNETYELLAEKSMPVYRFC